MLEIGTRPDMTLSDAMRLGAMWRPKTRHHLFHGQGSCALGAAAEGCGLRDEVRTICKRPVTPTDLVFEWPELVCRSLPCPACAATGDAQRGVLYGLIAHLNDFHNWTREAIADWLDTLPAFHFERHDDASETTLAESAR